MLKTLLIKPPVSLYPSKKGLNLELITQSLGLAYIAAVLEQNKYPVAIIDAPAQGFYQKEIFKFIKNYQPDVIGFTSITQEFPTAVRLAKKIRKIFPRLKIFIGGPHASAVPREVLKTNVFDFVIIGEGEITILKLIKELKKPSPNFTKIKGIGFKKGKKISLAPSRARIKNIDKIPFPARHLMPPLKAYKPTSGAYKNLPIGTIITSRGCPFKCTFCDRNIFGNITRLRSPKNTVDEMEILVKKYKAKEIRVWDDTFNIKPERVIQICKLILKRKLSFTWTCLCRVNFINKKMLSFMKKAGCWQISYGIESGNQEILNRIQKAATLSMTRKAVSQTKKAGIEVKGFFIIGLPDDTPKTIQQTINFAKSLPLDIAAFSILIPFPGTKIYKDALKTGELKKISYKNYIPCEARKLAFIPKGLSERQIIDFQKKAYKQFYFRPKIILKEIFKINSPKILWIKIRGLIDVLQKVIS